MPGNNYKSKKRKIKRKNPTRHANRLYSLAIYGQEIHDKVREKPEVDLKIYSFVKRLNLF